jgi:hypothetical protein
MIVALIMRVNFNILLFKMSKKKAHIVSASSTGRVPVYVMDPNTEIWHTIGSSEADDIFKGTRHKYNLYCQDASHRHIACFGRRMKRSKRSRRRSKRSKS